VIFLQAGDKLLLKQVRIIRVEDLDCSSIAAKLCGAETMFQRQKKCRMILIMFEVLFPPIIIFFVEAVANFQAELMFVLDKFGNLEVIMFAI